MELCIERDRASECRGTGAEEPRTGGWGGPAPETLDVPGDIGSWVCPSTLLSWVVDEAEKLNWSNGEAAGGWQEWPPDRRQVMLCVLAFAYARQMFDGEGIARACRTEPMLHRLCRGSAPFAAELQSFRRKNRPVLERILTRVLTRAIQYRFDLGRVLLPGELEEDLRKLAAERLNIARHMDAVD